MTVMDLWMRHRMTLASHHRQALIALEALQLAICYNAIRAAFRGPQLRWATTAPALCRAPGTGPTLCRHTLTIRQEVVITANYQQPRAAPCLCLPRTDTSPHLLPSHMLLLTQTRDRLRLHPLRRPRQLPVALAPLIMMHILMRVIIMQAAMCSSIIMRIQQQRPAQIHVECYPPPLHLWPLTRSLCRGPHTSLPSVVTMALRCAPC